jgi:hypothetical protein
MKKKKDGGYLRPLSRGLIANSRMRRVNGGRLKHDRRHSRMKMTKEQQELIKQKSWKANLHKMRSSGPVQERLLQTRSN